MRGEPSAFAPRLSKLAVQVEPDLMVYSVMTLDEVVRRRDLPMLMFMFGAVTIVLLSAAGLFALVSVAVSRRTREIGVSGIMLVVGIAACAVPARRALRVQPKEALIET